MSVQTSLYNWDVAVFKAIHLGWHSPALDPVFLAFTCLGDGWYLTAICFAALIARKTRPLFWPMITSLVLGGIAGADLLKAIISRERPSLLPFAAPQEAWKYNSFPSGHTASAFAVATTFLLFVQETELEPYGWAAIALAAGVGLSRIYRGIHWPTDVIGGALCGVAFGIATYLAFKAAGYTGTASETRPSERKRA